MLIPEQGKTDAKQETLKDFVQFILTDGQSAAESLQYSKLPQSLAGLGQKLLAESKVGHNKVPSIKASANNSFQQLQFGFILFFTRCPTVDRLPVRSRLFNPPRVYFETQAGGVCLPRSLLVNPEEALVFN